ncbi:hypothetical protein BV25DRAFT_996535 [Artomyces pyxidatus]|uniref:Uncharacterized protein n=1 Tax=Artomyces pyxidatus TaxID=48021 RepID=A0ACB8SVS8_9AGAM|nr:hypothetical protein BV25DRAFT_996535 [Artomyces pyxidatus]
MHLSARVCTLITDYPRWPRAPYLFCSDARIRSMQWRGPIARARSRVGLANAEHTKRPRSNVSFGRRPCMAVCVSARAVRPPHRRRRAQRRHPRAHALSKAADRALLGRMAHALTCRGGRSPRALSSTAAPCLPPGLAGTRLRYASRVPSHSGLPPCLFRRNVADGVIARWLPLPADCTRAPYPGASVV